MPDRDNLPKEAAEAIDDSRRLRAEINQLSMNYLGAVEAITRDDADTRHFADDLERARNRAVELLERISELLERIAREPGADINFGVRGTTATVFRLTTSANELQAEFEWLTSILEQIDIMMASSATSPRSWMAQKIAQPVQSALLKLKSYLMPLLKKFLSKLWSIISHLLTPKEWKLKGKVGNTVLGLAEAEIEITFGP